MNPFEYNAQEEYNKHLRETSVPGNIPREVMGKINARLVDEIMNSKELRASSLARNAGVAQKYLRMGKPERIQFVQDCPTLDVLQTLKVMEDDIQVLDFIVGRMRELTSQPEE